MSSYPRALWGEGSQDKVSGTKLSNNNGPKICGCLDGNW